MLLCSYIWLQSGKMLLDLSPVLEDGLTAEQVVEEASRVAGLLTARQSTLVQFIGRPAILQPLPLMLWTFNLSGKIKVIWNGFQNASFA